jgi:hypothetical protein
MAKAAQNTGKSTEKRKGRFENLRPPWPKGQSGNPGGRPKKTVLSDAMKAQLEMPYPGDKKKRTWAEVIAEKTAKKAIEGNIYAVSELGDRTEGRPRQAVELGGAGGGAIDVNITGLTEEKLDQEIRALTAIFGAAATGSGRSQAPPGRAVKRKGKARS